MTIVGNPDDAGDQQVEQSGPFVLIKNRLVFFVAPPRRARKLSRKLSLQPIRTPEYYRESERMFCWNVRYLTDGCLFSLYVSSIRGMGQIKHLEGLISKFCSKIR